MSLVYSHEYAPHTLAQTQAAARAVFLITGLGISAWAAIVPYVKSRLGLDDASLGILLLCSGAGSVLVMPFAGRMAGRMSCRTLIVASVIALCLVLCWLAIAPNARSLGIGLLIFGAIIGVLNVAINLHAVMLERQTGQALMSGFHCFYSFGCILGAGGMSILLWLGLPPVGAVAIVSLLMCGQLMTFGSHLLADHDTGPSRNVAAPRGIMLLICFLCFLAYIAEGSMLDWGAVFLASSRALDARYAGLGYALFAAAMMAGRLCGDNAIRTYGARTVLSCSSVMAAAGFVLAAVVPSCVVSLGAFVLIGAGAANIVPLLFSAAGRQGSLAPSAAIAAVSMVGCSGIMAGPVAIGFLAQHAGLPLAFAGIGVTILIVAGSSRAVTGRSAG